MILFPFGTYRFMQCQYWMWDYIPDATRRYCLWVSLALYVAMWSLNIYWYKLILTGVLKMLGIIKASDKSKKSDSAKVDEGKKKD